MEMKKLTLVMCIGAAISAPAFAGGNNDSTSNSESDSSVSLTKEVSVKKDLEYKGTVKIDGNIRADGLGMAVVDNVQASGGNLIGNDYLENDASIGDAAFGNASGNIGVNQAAGDFNVQGNSAALASIDASFAFGSGDAEIFSSQRGTFTGTDSYASTNTATIDGDAFKGASGNIGVNIAAGGNNVQANNMAASAFQGRLSEASVSNNQVSAHNGIWNTSAVGASDETFTASASVTSTGDYTGTSTLQEDFYPEIWMDDGEHANGDDATLVGHLDFDGNNPSGGEMAFDEVGELDLDVELSIELPYMQVMQGTSNTATLAGNAFNGASGNIGVNMASGHGNLQSNNLSLTSMTGGAIVSEAP